MSLRDAVQPDIEGNVSRLAEAVGVTRPSAWRWTRPVGHPLHVVPCPKYWPAIEKATPYRWRAPYVAFNGVAFNGGKPKRAPRAQHINIQAARRAAATRRRQRESRQSLA